MPQTLLPVLLLLAGLLSSSCIADAQDLAADGSFEQIIPLSGPGDVSVTSRSGSISVEAGASDQVQVRATIRAFGNHIYTAADQVRELEDAPPIRVSGSSIAIGEIDRWMLGHNVRISYDVTVPAAAHLRTSTRSGAQTIARVRGPIDATSRSGSIRVEDVNGTVRLGSRSGDVTVSGQPAGEWQIDTRSGDVVLRVPPSAGFDLDYVTRSGSIRTSEALQGPATRRRNGLTGRVHGGGPPVLVGTRSGSIRIE